MNTFLPYPDFFKCALVLDDKRLGKQRLEGLQILKILIGEQSNIVSPILKVLANYGPGWRRHPAVRMWKGCEGALVLYCEAVCNEHWSRFYSHSEIAEELGMIKRSLFKSQSFAMPHWLGDERLHLSHQSNLLRKNYKHYSRFFGYELSVEMPYYWPKERTWETMSFR